MDISYFAPAPVLKEYVDSIHVLKIDFKTPQGLSPIYTFVPTHTRFLCFYLEDPLKVKKGDGNYIIRARSVIIGPQLEPVTLDLGSRHSCVIVSLKPCGMHRLLGIPLEEIVDRDFDARLVMGPEIDELLNRLMESASNFEKNDIIQQYLVSKLLKLKPSLPFDKAMLLQVNGMGNISIDHLAKLSCLSLRQFERKSLQRLGLSPKLYARMVRFAYAYKYKERFPQASWNEIAYRFGYFDQMHFIHDFKSFAGFTPSMLKEETLKKSVRFNSIAD